MLPILPPALLQAPQAQVQTPARTPAIPRTVEARPGVFIVQGAPDEATFAALKAAGITRVFNLRTDEEGDFRFEETGAKAAGAGYTRCPVDHTLSGAALDAFRAQLRALPPKSRILVHCATGNRAAAALLTAWVLDQGLPVRDALALARQSGLTKPGLEAKALAYIRERRSAAE